MNLERQRVAAAWVIKANLKGVTKAVRIQRLTRIVLNPAYRLAMRKEALRQLTALSRSTR